MYPHLSLTSGAVDRLVRELHQGRGSVFLLRPTLLLAAESNLFLHRYGSAQEQRRQYGEGVFAKGVHESSEEKAACVYRSVA